MSALFETLTFTSVASVTYDFNGSNVSGGLCDTTVFTPTLTPRGTPRPRMQMHGTNPRALLFAGIELDHEGVFNGGTQAEALAERDAFLACLLGDLTSPPPDVSLGTLTVKRLGWAESASGPAQIDSYAAPIAAGDIIVFVWQVQWRFDLPYLIGDDSSDPVYL